MAFEHEVRKQVAARLKRGKIEVFIKQETAAGGAALPQLNIPLAKAYHKAFVSLREALGIGDPITLSLIATQKDELAAPDDESAAEELASALTSVVAAALEGIDGMREREGAALLADIDGRLALLDTLMVEVADRAPRVVEETVARQKERVTLLLSGQPLDEARISQEIAILADRCDITEELVRFRSHMQQFRATLASDEPVGRKLDFLLQELNREVNTVGSKANDAEIASRVVQLKAELEKIREQVQNIE
jgi:uncharacterized protein (TIGR00255 family)